MTALGVFRDDFYNCMSVLGPTQYNSTTATGAVTMAASVMAGAQSVFYETSALAAAEAYTTDSAVNIIAAIQNAVATAYKKGLGSFAAGVNPPPGVPNLFNASYLFTFINTSGQTATVTAGAGVTVTGTATVATLVARTYAVTITSPTTVVLQNLYAADAT